MWKTTKTFLGFVLLGLVLLATTVYYQYQAKPMEYPSLKMTYSKKTIVIVYNRVPKSGSSSMIALLTMLSRRYQRFIFKHSPNHWERQMSLEKQIELSDLLSRYADNVGDRSLVFNRHFYFFQLRSTSKAVFKYINMVRDPLQRAISAYDYTRYRYLTRERARKRISPSFVNLTIEQCLQSENSVKCAGASYGGATIAFFCGQSSVCHGKQTRSMMNAAVSLAKSNIERFYLWVGVLEYLESSLELLESIAPNIFHGITTLYREKMKGVHKNVTPGKYRNLISNKTRAILRERLEPEYELYEFVRMRFINHYRHVFKRSPLSSTDH